MKKIMVVCCRLKVLAENNDMASLDKKGGSIRYDVPQLVQECFVNPSLELKTGY